MGSQDSRLWHGPPLPWERNPCKYKGSWYQVCLSCLFHYHLLSIAFPWCSNLTVFVWNTFDSGYMAPEYVMNGRLTVKADVFSFGVLMLELVTGRRNSSFNMSRDADNLLDWVISCSFLYNSSIFHSCFSLFQPHQIRMLRLRSIVCAYDFSPNV